MFSVSESIKQERADRGSLVEANFHCKGFACSCSTPHYIFALMVHILHQFDVLLCQPLVSHAPIQSFPRDSVLCYTLYSSLRFVMDEVLPATSSPPHLIVISTSSVSCLLLPVFLLSYLPHISLNAVLPSQSWPPSSPPALLTELCRSLR